MPCPRCAERWIADVLGDPPLSATVAEVEAGVRDGTLPLDAGRERLLAAVHDRYPG